MERPKAEPVLQRVEQAQLQGIVALALHLHIAALRSRAQIIAGSAPARPTAVSPRGWNCTTVTVGNWRRRFIERRVTGLHDEPAPGQRRSINVLNRSAQFAQIPGAIVCRDGGRSPETA